MNIERPKATEEKVKYNSDGVPVVGGMTLKDNPALVYLLAWKHDKCIIEHRHYRGLGKRFELVTVDAPI